MFYTLQSLGFLESCIYDKLCLLDWLVEFKKIQLICFKKVSTSVTWNIFCILPCS